MVDLNLSTLAWSQFGDVPLYTSNSLSTLLESLKPLLLKHKRIEKLHDWQNECLSLPAVENGKNLLLSMPTSGGKTLIAEVLAMNEMLTNRKDVIFIVPFISIAHEKVTSLSPFGIELCFHIKEYAGSRGRFPPVKHRKKNSVYICTIEKSLILIQSLLETNRIKEIGLVIVDEVHLIGNNTRGALVENILIRLKLAGGIQIVGMSATIGNLDEIGSFMIAEIYESNFRPVKVQEYVKVKNEIFIVQKNGNEDPINYYSEYIPKDHVWPSRGMDSDGITNLILDVIPNGSCLIFCPTKQSAENISKMVCSHLPRELFEFKKKEKFDLYSNLRTEGGGYICPILSNTIRYGVAYHHAGLSMEERSLIEDAYLSKIIQCICSTSTLAAGVNLPAERVIIRSPFVGTDLMTFTTYKQMIGRAGRAGFGVKGESYILCHIDDAAKVGSLLTSNMDRCESQLLTGSNSGLSSLILNAVHTGWAKNTNDLMRILSESLLGLQNKQFCIEDNISGLVEELISKGILSALNSELQLTDLGRAVVKGNLEVDYASELLQQLESALSKMVLLDRLHLLFLVTPSWQELSRFKFEYQTIANISQSNGTIKKFISALILNNLLTGMSLRQAGETFLLTRGDINGLSSTTSSCASAILRFCEEIPKLWSFVRLLTDLPHMLMYCCLPELYTLMELPSVQKGRASQLYKAGYKDIKSVAKADPKELSLIIANFPVRQAEKIVVAAKLKMLSLAEELKEEAERNLEVDYASELLQQLESALSKMVLLDRLHLLFLVTPSWQELSRFKFEYQTIANIVFLKLKDTEITLAKVIGIDEGTIARIAAGYKTVSQSNGTIKKFISALILNNLLTGMSLRQAGETFLLTRGDINGLSSTTSSCASAILRFCEEIPKLWSFVRLLTDLPHMLMYCCLPELYTLMELPSVQKGRASQLYKAGYKDIKSVAKADPKELSLIIANFPVRQAEKIVVAAKLKMLSLAEELKEEAESLFEYFEENF